MTEGKEVMGNEDCKGEIYRRYCGVCEEVCRTVWDQMIAKLNTNIFSLLQVQ